MPTQQQQSAIHPVFEVVIRINDAIVRLLNLIGARAVTRLAEVHKPTSPKYAVGPSGRRRKAGSDAGSSGEDGWGFGVSLGNLEVPF